MGDLQITIEFSIELHKFINVDLFQRGYYQVRTALRSSPKLPTKIEVSLPKNNTCTLAFPACVVNGTAVSKTFQILYKNEEVLLDDIILFKVHVLSDGYRVRDALLKAGFQLIVELWFTDQNFGPDQHSSIQCVSTRLLQLHFDPCRGLHHHLPVVFDYFHLSTVTVTIHSSVLAICQPYLSLHRLPKSPFTSGSPRLSTKKAHFSSLEILLFGSQHAGRALPTNNRLHRAQLVHWELCSFLLAAYLSLQRKLLEYMKLLPPWQQIGLDSSDCFSKLEGLSSFAKECQKQLQKNNGIRPFRKDNMATSFQGFDNEEELLIMANSDIAQLCGALVVLWQHFVELVVAKETVRQHLSRQHHQQRVKRFSEAFFLVERPRNSIMQLSEMSTQLYQETTEDLRHSAYLMMLPPLEVECVDLDGDFSSLPIIYEEHYQETARRQPSVSCVSQSAISLADVSFLLEDCEPGPKPNNSQRSDSQSSAQKANSHGISKSSSLSTSSLSEDLPVFSPISKTAPSFNWKTSLKDRFMSSLRLDVDTEREDYNVASGFVLSKRSSKIALRSRIKIRSRTANFLRQFRKVNTNGVVLLGIKHIENSKSTPCFEKRQKIPLLLEIGMMRHSLSAFSVVGGFCCDRRSGLSNSESMPDLSTMGIPPPPPPPRQRFASSEFNWSCFDHPDSLCIKQKQERKSPTLAPPVSANGRNVSVSNRSLDRSACDANARPKMSNTLPRKKSCPTLHRSPLSQLKIMQRKMTYDDSVKRSVADERGPPSPPIQFRDPPVKKVETKPVVEKSPTEIVKNIRSFECQGTMFFPKPPAEFLQDSQVATTEVQNKSETVDSLVGNGESLFVAKADESSPEEKVENYENGEISKPDVNLRKKRLSYFENKCTIMEMLTDMSDPEDYYGSELYGKQVKSNCHHQRSRSLANTFSWDDEAPSLRRISAIGSEMISFVKAKEEFRQDLQHPWLWYSDFPSPASTIPYFQCDNDIRAFSSEGLHLVVCVHGLDGNSADLRLVRTYLELGLPTVNFEFLMSERNQGETFDDFETMTDRLVSEIMYHMEVFGLKPNRISFIGHSLGNIIIRSALSRPEIKPYISLLHTFLSLSGPHLGTLYNNSGLVNMGMWFMQKWKKSGSLLQLSMKDAMDPRQTFLHKLSKKPGLEYFQNVLLFGSSQDRYVPVHSARIELSKSAVKDGSLIGTAYREMVSNLLQPILRKPEMNFIRYDVHHALPSSANSLIGRAAHIAVLDSELFIEKFMVVCGLKYFS